MEIIILGVSFSYTHHVESQEKKAPKDQQMNFNINLQFSTLLKFSTTKHIYIYSFQ